MGFSMGRLIRNVLRFIEGKQSPPSPQKFLPSPITPPAPATQTIKQDVVVRRRIYGRSYVTGNYFVYESNQAHYLLMGIYLCDGPIDGFDALICDDEVFTVYVPTDAVDGQLNVFFPSSGLKRITGFSGALDWAHSIIGNLIAMEPVNASNGGYVSYLLGTTSVGLDPAAFGGLWDSSHLGKGVTCLYALASTNSTNGDRIKFFPNGFPEFKIVLRGSRVYDPRDPRQSFLNPTTGLYDIYNPTWKWTENPALIAADYVAWLISQNLTAIKGINYADIAIAANDCDALVPATRTIFGGGSAMEPFARMTAVVPYDMEPRDVLMNIMMACDGIYSTDKDGLFTMFIGKWEDPAVTFTGTDIGGFTEEFLEASNDTVNYIHSTYVEHRQLDQKYEAPVYSDLISQAQTGIRIATRDYAFVPSANQAYRLTQRYAKRINGKKKLSIVLGPRAMMALRQRVVGLNAPDFGLSGVWRIEALQPDTTLATWTATLREITTDVFSDTPAPVDPIASLYIVNPPTITAPASIIAIPKSSGVGIGFVALSLDVNLNTQNVAIPQINTAAMIQDQTLELDGRYSLNGGATWAAFTIALSQFVLRTPDLPTGTVVTVQARWIGVTGVLGPFSSSAAATIP
jgi:hypothetical protein